MKKIALILVPVCMLICFSLSCGNSYKDNFTTSAPGVIDPLQNKTNPIGNTSAELPGELMPGTKLVGVWQWAGPFRRPFSLEIISIQGDKVKANYCWQVPTALDFGTTDASWWMIGSMNSGCNERTGVIKDSSITFRFENRNLRQVEMVMDMEKNRATYYVYGKTLFSPITVKAGGKGAVE